MAAAQTLPTYSIATGKPEEPIVNELISKYDNRNVSWPIVLNENNKTIAYLYEKNVNNAINDIHDNRPSSLSNLKTFFLDYTSNPRKIVPHADFLTSFINASVSCSYEYIPTSPFSTVDLDYVWNFGNGFKGFELTTFWVPFKDHSHAKSLVSKMNRRYSWQGPNGPHALHKIVDCAADLGIDYYLVCANTVNKIIGSPINTNGNVLFFPLSHAQINLLSNGKPPQNSKFDSFSNFLNWL